MDQRASQENTALQQANLLQQTITSYKIRRAGGQAHHYFCTGTLKQRYLNQSSLTGLTSARIMTSLPSSMADLYHVIVCCKRPITQSECTFDLLQEEAIGLLLSLWCFAILVKYYFVSSQNNSDTVLKTCFQMQVMTVQDNQRQTTTGVLQFQVLRNHSAQTAEPYPSTNRHLCPLMGLVWTVSNGHLKTEVGAQIPTARHLGHMPPVNASIAVVSSAQLVLLCLGHAARIQMGTTLCQTCDFGDPNPRFAPGWRRGSRRKRKVHPGSVNSAP